MLMILCFLFVDYNVDSVEGTLMEVPDPAVNTELQLCISFESNTSSDQIVVLAHHTDQPKQLSAYFPPDDECFRAPTAGRYYFAVFTQNSDSTLEAPGTPPVISRRTMCKYSCFNPACTPHS